MAKKNIIINSKTYENVHELTAPLAAGEGVARFVETSDATATAGQILAGEIAYVDGAKVVGTMPNNGAKSQTLTCDVIEFTIPEGYHNGEGKVNISLETKSAVPTKEQQVVNASPGKVMSSFTVEPIPDEYQVVTGVTATAADVKQGKVFVAADGSEITGTHTDPTFTLANGVLAIA